MRTSNLFLSIPCPKAWWVNVDAVEAISNALVMIFSAELNKNTKKDKFVIEGIDPHVKELFYKLASVNLCPPVQGQIMVPFF